eukprot:gene4309-8569_t
MGSNGKILRNPCLSPFDIPTVCFVKMTVSRFPLRAKKVKPVEEAKPMRQFKILQKMSIELKLKSVIGFSGTVSGALHYTPCGKFMIYPLGSFVVVRNIKTEKEAFLDGHTREVSCISVSHDGQRLASGQVNFLGVKADLIIWNLADAKSLCNEGKVMIGETCLLYRLKQHLSKVQGVSFSANDHFLCSLGGQDDNALVVWNAATGVALCGAPAAQDSALCCKWLNGRNDRMVTAGVNHLRVWQVDFSLPKLHPMDARFGSVRRVIQVLDITNDDQFAYCGTTTGDLLQVKIDRNDIHPPNEPDTTIPVFVKATQERFSKGISAVLCVFNQSTHNTNVLIGAGDGVMTYVNPNLKVVKDVKTQLMGTITSMSMVAGGGSSGKLLVGTDQCNRYEVTMDLQTSEMKSSCHAGAVNDIAFPQGCSDLIVTSSIGDIRIWNVRVKQELLRIQLPNLECLCCCVSPSGGTIVSGWNDGKIRAFYPETGRLKFVINDAHSEKVTALVICGSDTTSPWKLVSGGAEGRVRVWNITSATQALAASLKEHRGPVNCLRINRDSTQCVSASADGSCIVWDIERCVRIMAFFEANVFGSVLYHPDESQLLTCGSNHKITYWDATDGQAIRVIQGAEDICTTLDIDPTGEFFVSGAGDKVVKIWHYDDGITVAMGRAHSGAIKAVKISPDQKTIVSVGSTGEIVFWEMPSLTALRNARMDDASESKGGGRY